MTRLDFPVLMCLAVLGFVLIFSAGGVWAQESIEKDQAVKEQHISEKDKKAVRAQRRKIRAQVKAITEGLSPADETHFSLIYSNYNLIKTVEIIQDDVRHAVSMCAKNNPELDEKMNKRYEQWSAALAPVLSESKGHLNNMVLVQEYADTDDINALFLEMDQTRNRIDDQIKKIPVTTPEACEYLHEKMDETQETMLKLLRKTLISYPSSLPEADDELKDQTQN